VKGYKKDWWDTYVEPLLVGLVLLFIGACFYGYIMNIVAIWNASGFTGKLLFRIAGVVIPPLGSLLGFL
jgi:hypothetical protein